MAGFIKKGTETSPHGLHARYILFVAKALLRKEYVFTRCVLTL